MTAMPEVREAMLAAIPSLRAFAISLTYNVDAADDLVQEAILRAWANIEKFEAGTNMTAWLFTILRNQFHTGFRRRRRERGSGTMLNELRFHLDLSNWIGYPLARVPRRQGPALAALLGLWQTANFAGFLYEKVRRRPARRP